MMSGPPAAPSWFEVASVGELVDGTVVPVAVEARRWRPRTSTARCSPTATRAQGAGVDHDGELRAGALMCRHCERSFFLPRAGRSLDDSELQLEPVPLLRETGHVKVALAENQRSPTSRGS